MIIAMRYHFPIAVDIYDFLYTGRFDYLEIGQSAESIFAVFPLLAVGITPILGKYVDNKGKAASMLMLGSILLIVCHLTFAFVLPQFKSSPLGGSSTCILHYISIRSFFLLSSCLAMAKRTKIG